jgi:hypothetical protein
MPEAGNTRIQMSGHTECHRAQSMTAISCLETSGRDRNLKEFQRVVSGRVQCTHSEVKKSAEDYLPLVAPAYTRAKGK